MPRSEDFVAVDAVRLEADHRCQIQRGFPYQDDWEQCENDATILAVIDAIAYDDVEPHNSWCCWGCFSHLRDGMLECDDCAYRDADDAFFDSEASAWKCPACGSDDYGELKPREPPSTPPIATDGGLEVMWLDIERVCETVVPRDEANSYVHTGIDSHYHPTGGYWYPSDQEPSDEQTGIVADESEILNGELIQYPLDDISPRIVGRDDLHDWVKDRRVKAVTDGGKDIPEDHPLSGYEHLLDTHEGHLEAMSRVLEDADPDEYDSVMLVLGTEETADTIPSFAPQADEERQYWLSLAAHLGHVTQVMDAGPVDVAKHTVHVLNDIHSDRGPVATDGGTRLDREAEYPVKRNVPITEEMDDAIEDAVEDGDYPPTADEAIRHAIRETFIRGDDPEIVTDGGQQQRGRATPRDGPDPHPGTARTGSIDCPACGDPVDGILTKHLREDCPEWGGGYDD